MVEKRNRQQRIGIVFLCFATLCEILVTLSYERGVLTVQHYLGPVCCAFLGMMLLGGQIRLYADEIIALLYPLWYVASRIMLREFYLNDSFYPFCSMLLIYALAFPFAGWMNDSKRKTGLRAVSVLFGAVYGALAWVGVYAAISDQKITLPWLGTTFDLEIGTRLGMSTHPNVTACIFVSAFVLVLWLMLADGRRGCLMTGTIALLGLYFAISLTNSRTVMIQLSGVMAVLTLFGCEKLRIRSHKLRVFLPYAAALVVLILTYLSFDAALKWLTEWNIRFVAQAETIVTNRDLAKDLLTINARTPIYRASLEMIADHPSILLFGTRETQTVSMLQQYIDTPNAHNAWLQVVLQTGIPGLAVGLWFTWRAAKLGLEAIVKRDLYACLADRFLAVAPLILLMNGISESYVLTELKPYYNFVFFLMLGYALVNRRRLRSENEKVED